jgi:hypothetical protein
VYYIINKTSMTCIHKGMWCERNSYIDAVNNKIISFNYSKITNLLFLEIREFELIDFSKVINLDNFFPNEKKGFICEYQIPSSKNFIIKLESKTYYYNYFKNSIEIFLIQILITLSHSRVNIFAMRIKGIFLSIIIQTKHKLFYLNAQKLNT